MEAEDERENQWGATGQEMSPGQAPYSRHGFSGLPHSNHSTPPPSPLAQSPFWPKSVIRVCSHSYIFADPLHAHVLPLPWPQHPKKCWDFPSPRRERGQWWQQAQRLLRQRDNSQVCSWKTYFRLLFPLLWVTLAKAVYPGGLAQNVLLLDVGPCYSWLRRLEHKQHHKKTDPELGSPAFVLSILCSLKDIFVYELGLVPKTRSHKKQLVSIGGSRFGQSSF